MTPQTLSIWATAVAAASTVVTAVAACAAAVIYRNQTREMETQSRLLTKSIEGSNLMRLVVDVLDEKDRREARKRIMVLSNQGVPLERWTEDDRRAADLVIRTFDLMGLMVRRDLLERELILETFGTRVIQMHAATRGMLDELRLLNGPKYMNHFDWLNREALAQEAREGPLR